VAAPPKISLRLHGGMQIPDCVALAEAAEGAGCHGLWFAENPFARGIISAMTACAAVTGKVRIGPGVLNPFARHPAMIAMEIGALDEFSGGRVRLGIGAGVGHAIERMGFSYDRPVAAVRDAVTIIRALLRGETVDHPGRVIAARGIGLDFKTRTDLPIYLAGRGDQTLRLCGELADGLFISNMCAPGFVARAVEIVRDAAVAAGRTTPIEFVQYVPCSIQPIRSEAIRQAKRAVADMLPGFWRLAQRLPSARNALLHGSGIAAEEFEKAAAGLAAGKPPEGVLDERFVAAFAIAGTAEECRAQVADFARRGITELALTMSGPEPGHQIRSLMPAGTPG
jgi:5,10-methylenetetrahydromethanopterin reductase